MRFAIHAPCPNFPKSKPPSAVLPACSTGGDCCGSSRAAPTCAGRCRVDLGQRLTGARGHRPVAARQIWPDRHRPRRYVGVPPRHVGTLANRPGRDRRARSSADRHRRRPPAQPQRPAPLRLARPGRDRRACRLADLRRAWPRAAGPRADRRVAQGQVRRAKRGGEIAAARPEDRCRAWQYIRVRGAVPRANRSAQGGRAGR